MADGHPVTARQLAEADGKAADQRTLTRYGQDLRALRDAGCIQERERARGTYQRGGSVSYVITSAARQAIEENARPGPVPLPAGTHWWDAEAAVRHKAGENLALLGDAYGVDPSTVARSLRRQGVKIRQALPRRPRASPNPEWAAEAARRYTAGEPLLALRREYRAGDARMKRVLRSQGAELRGRAWQSLTPPPPRPRARRRPAIAPVKVTARWKRAARPTRTRSPSRGAALAVLHAAYCLISPETAPRLPREGTVRRGILGHLAAGGPMTARQLADAGHAGPGQPPASRYRDHLRALREAGHVRVHESPPGTPASYALTAAARQALEEDARPKPTRWPRGTHWWDADAVARHLAGESLAVLGAEYGTAATTVLHVVQRMRTPGSAPRLPAEGTRRRRLLTRMAAAGEPVTARQLAEADGAEPARCVLTGYGNHLRALRDAGCVREDARNSAGWQQGHEVSYVVTGAARQALEDAARPPGSPPADLGT
jgi:hypothetical protein